VERFPAPEELTDMMRGCGFDRVEVFPLTGGISVLYLAYRER
jgi:ubiquinone/menaquinone biosynthesis C-methylase UbiE